MHQFRKQYISQLMNFIPLTREQKRRMEQKRREKQQQSKLGGIAIQKNLSPILQSDGATTDREKLTHLNEDKKEEILTQPLIIQEKSIQSHPMVAQHNSPQHTDNKQVQIEQFNHQKVNTAIQPSRDSKLQQEHRNRPQIPFENQEQKMSPKKSVRLKRDLNEVLDYAKPVQGFAFIQFIQSKYSPEQNKQNHRDGQISQSHQQSANTNERKSSKRALNNGSKSVNPEIKQVVLIEPIEENGPDYRRSFKRNLSRTSIIHQNSQSDNKKLNIDVLKVREQEQLFNRISAIKQVVTQPTEERINHQQSQRLTRSLNSGAVLSHHEAEEKVSPLPDSSIVPLQENKQSISIHLKEFTQDQFIQEKSRKSFLKRNLQNSTETVSVNHQICIDDVSNQVILESSRKSFLKRSLQNFKPEASICEPVFIDCVQNQIIQGSSRKSFLQRNLQNNSNYKPESVCISQQVCIDHDISHQIIQGSNQKSYLKRNLQNSSKMKPKAICQPVSIDQVLNQIIEGRNQTSFLKRNLQNSRNYKDETASISVPVFIGHTSEQIIEISDPSKKYTRNLSRNIDSYPMCIQPKEIQTSHKIHDQDALSEKSNSSEITQGWNDQKQIFKIFRLQSTDRKQSSDIMNASQMKKLLNSLHLK